MDVEPQIARLFGWMESHDFRGFDPYDALNSPLAGGLSLGSRFGRIALTQLLRRSPVNFRPLLLIRPGRNPKALALALESCAALELPPEKASHIFDLLMGLRSTGTSGNAWGYNFPWQNRVQCLPRFTPTIVNTAFAGHALLDCFERYGEQKYLDAAQSIPAFMLNDLARKNEAGAFCFAYTPLDKNFVHNASMLGASFLARMAAKYGRGELLDPARSALAYSMSHQHDDGSWYYAETGFQNWIDSFHTGFNLEALRRFIRLGITPEYAEKYRRGVEFYAGHFFEKDGTPDYYADRFYLADIHAPAEAVTFFSGEGEAYAGLVDRVLRWTFENMYDPKTGLFFFRRARRFTIRTPYMRWSEAWALRALACHAASGKASQ
ncbi:MAG: hypothetical protein PHI35_05165 [Victivallaceae bacterium]|nr:hypothetical protein [Victivallaceae bacterium]